MQHGVFYPVIEGKRSLQGLSKLTMLVQTRNLPSNRGSLQRFVEVLELYVALPGKLPDLENPRAPECHMCATPDGLGPRRTLLLRTTAARHLAQRLVVCSGRSTKMLFSSPRRATAPARSRSKASALCHARLAFRMQVLICVDTYSSLHLGINQDHAFTRQALLARTRRPVNCGQQLEVDGSSDSRLVWSRKVKTRLGSPKLRSLSRKP